MSESEAPTSLLEQTKRGLIPPLTVQVDVTQVQSLFQQICEELIRMQEEIDELKKRQFGSARPSDPSNLYLKFEQLAKKEDDDVSRINQTLDSLKNGEHHPGTFDGNLAGEVQSDITGDQPRLQTVYLQPPIPSDQAAEIADKLKSLSDRVAALESKSPARVVSRELKPTDAADEDLINEINDQKEKINQILDDLNSLKEKHDSMNDNPINKVIIPPAVFNEVSSDNDIAIKQLNERLNEAEQHLSNLANLSNGVRDQLAFQKGKIDDINKTLNSLKKMMDQRPIQKATPRKPQPTPNSNQDIDPEFKEMYGDDTPKTDGGEEYEQPRTVRANFDTDELLDTFMEATKAEVERSHKQIMEDVASTLRAIANQLNGNISKAASAFDMGLSRANTRITEQGAQFQTDLNRYIVEQQNALKDLNVASTELNEKLRGLDQRVEALTALASKPPPKMEALIDEDGKVNLGVLLQQMGAQANLFTDITNRIQALEDKESVSPKAFQALEELVNGHETKVKALDVTTVQTDLKVAELREILDGVKAILNDPEDDENKVKEFKESLKTVEDETKRLRDAMVKFNKDMIGCRAAINTLRSHSEEESASIEEIRKTCDETKEQAQNTDVRLKKVIVFIQNENKEINKQIKDLSDSIDRNMERIEEIANREPIVTESSRKEESYQESDTSLTSDRFYSTNQSPRSITQSEKKKKKKEKKPPKVENVDAMTSPHAPPPLIDEQPNPDLIIPKLPQPVIQQQPMQQYQQTMQPGAPQVVQLPPQVVYEQPVVTLVRKQMDLEHGQALAAAKAKLPRLKPQGMRAQSEVTKNDLKKYDEIFTKLDQFDSRIASIKSAIDSLLKQIKKLEDTKAEKDSVQALFDQFRLAMSEVNNRIGSLRKNIVQKADVNELQQLRLDVAKEFKVQGETAAGTETVRCLLCGNPRHSVAGAIDDPILQRMIGPGVSSRVTGADGNGNVCFVYGEHGEMYLGRSQDGKPIVLKNLLNEPSSQRSQKSELVGESLSNPPTNRSEAQ